MSQKYQILDLVDTDRPRTMGAKNKKRSTKQAKKGKSKKKESVCLPCYTMLWNGNRALTSATIARHEGKCTPSCGFTCSAREKMTTSDPDAPAYMIMMGGPQRHGSVTLDDFTPRLLHMPCDDSVGRLGLFADYHKRPLHPRNLIRFANNEDAIEAAGGPYSSNFMDKVAIVTMLKNVHRDSSFYSDLPVFDDVVTTLGIYQEHQNAFWGMFYCEFYRLVNHLVRESASLMPESLGYKWNKKSIGGVDCGFMSMESDSGVKDERFIEMVDAIMKMVDEIVNMTPCLIHPVGIQHMTPGEIFTMETNIHRCLDAICAKNSWLGECCPDTGEMKSRMTRVNFKEKSHWRLVRHMIINLKWAHHDAGLISSCVGNFVQNNLGLHAAYSTETMEEVQDEDPLMYGYRLRAAELIRNLKENEPIEKGWVPFNYPKFVKHLSARTGVAEIEYLPPYLQLRGAVSMMVGVSTSSATYLAAWNKGLGCRHEHILMNMTERMKAEFMDYPTGYWYGKLHQCYKEYPPLMVIILRLKCADLSEERTASSSICDLHRNKDSAAVVFATWGATLIASTYNSSYISGIREKDDLPMCKWKPYNPKPETKVQSEFLQRLSVMGYFKDKVLPEMAVLVKRREVLKRSILKSKLTRLVRGALSHERLRSFARKIHLRACLPEVHEELKSKKRSCIIDTLVGMLKRKREEEKAAQEQIAREKAYDSMVEKQHLEFLEKMKDDLRKRLEYFVIHNIFNDPHLLSYRNPVDGSFPLEVFFGFPSLLYFLNLTSNPVKFFMDSAALSEKIEPIESHSFSGNPYPAIMPRRIK